MAHRFAFMLSLLAALAGVRAGAWAGVRPEARAGQVDRIVERVARIRESSGMASAWLVMVEGERTLVDRGFGIRAWDDPRPVSERDYYRLGSISKAFTGLALLEAAELGCLDLDAPVRTYVDNPPLTNRWSASRPVTIAMLMEQTAGWHDMSGFEFKYNDPVSLDEALALRPESRASRWPPGRHHSYTSSGPGMAAWVLEKACGRDFEAFARERVFEPLGMPSAAFTRTAEVERYLVGGYDTDPKQPIRYWHFLYRPAGALNVRPGEMAKFLKMLLQRGRLDGRQVFNPGQIERMETPATTLAARAGMDYGYGLGIYADIEDGRRYFAHGGDADGYLTRFGYNPESKRGFFVVITMFDHDPLREMRESLESWVVEPLPRTTPAPHAPATGALEKLAGSYRRATIRFPRDGWREDRMQIRADGDRLEYRTGRRWRLLIPVAPNLFRRPGDPVATAFIGEHDGKVYAQGEFGNWVKDSGG
ncbi:MAG: serine hydrolase domain-containing protein [Wenzhouxiangellaceae bacterium]|nr:serine hydrolase domain-containing protein [Wenzhouxiangellaceae bacterium]